jgi:hypothetical protein
MREGLLNDGKGGITLSLTTTPLNDGRAEVASLPAMTVYDVICPRLKELRVYHTDYK